MRALTIVGLKILGVMSLYWATGIIPSIIGALTTLSFSKHPEFDALNIIPQVVAWFGFNLIFGLLLLLRTEWIVAKLRIPNESFQSSVSPSELLRVGLVIVGVFVIIRALSESGAALCMVIQKNPSNSPTQSGWGLMIGALIELLLAVLVLARSRCIASHAFPAASDASN